MRKLIVSSLVTLDGYYEGPGRSLEPLFEYFHQDYAGDQQFDLYNTERIRAADTLLLGGRTGFLGNKEYWTSVPDDPNATEIRREFAHHIAAIPKVVVSDKLTAEELTPWTDTRIIRLADAHAEVAALKQQPDERLGQAVTLVVEGDPLPGTVEQALLAAMAERVQRYEMPRRVVYLTAFAETATGKIDRATSVARVANFSLRDGSQSEKLATVSDENGDA